LQVNSKCAKASGAALHNVQIIMCLIGDTNYPGATDRLTWHGDLHELAREHVHASQQQARLSCAQSSLQPVFVHGVLAPLLVIESGAPLLDGDQHMHAVFGWQRTFLSAGCAVTDHTTVSIIAHSGDESAVPLDGLASSKRRGEWGVAEAAVLKFAYSADKLREAAQKHGYTRKGESCTGAKTVSGYRYSMRCSTCFSWNHGWTRMRSKYMPGPAYMPPRLMRRTAHHCCGCAWMLTACMCLL
jgi:hypothetical protein